MLIFQDICNICTESKHTLPKSSPREKQYELPDRSAQELIRNDDQRGVGKVISGHVLNLKESGHEMAKI